jgi:hypothetical protein
MSSTLKQSSLMKVECSTQRRPHTSLAIVVAALVLAACAADGPELGAVYGKVMMDGKPVPFAQLTFEPEGPGRAATGLANENGEYELEYSPTAEGALVGPVLVRISTLTAVNPETIPPQYNTKSELKRKVESGSNEINFELESGGWKSKARPTEVESL